jgi:hypothetical protein
VLIWDNLQLWDWVDLTFDDLGNLIQYELLRPFRSTSRGGGIKNVRSR